MGYNSVTDITGLSPFV